MRRQPALPAEPPRARAPRQPRPRSPRVPSSDTRERFEGRGCHSGDSPKSSRTAALQWVHFGSWAGFSPHRRHQAYGGAVTGPHSPGAELDLTANARSAHLASLTLGHILAAMGAEHDPPIRLEDIRVIRHALLPGSPYGLRGQEDLTERQVLDYTRTQGTSTRNFPADPGKYWLVLIADGQRRSRLWGVYENEGELVEERNETTRFFDLRRSNFLAPLAHRLVVDWSSPRSWHRRAASAAGLPVLEIADRDKVPFPGFDSVLLTYAELREMVEDHRYADWRVALSEVQGIYLITDSSNGKQYVGKADGDERILQRWTAYAHDGHGGNTALRQLANASGDGNNSAAHSRHFVFSILRVFGPSTSSSEVNHAEAHYKKALMSREFGLNGN